jgi:anthranilate synthase component 2
MNILMIDNYDSFTYNLVHLLESFDGVDVTVIRNDEIELSDVEPFSKIVLSPGPGIPLEAGRMPEIVRHYAPRKSILGVCLGHQCIGEIFGGTLLNLSSPVHGKATSARVIDRTEPLFTGLPEMLTVGRYHSWVVAKDSIPECLTVTAVDDGGEIMALRHGEYDVRGVQFHPVSILTHQGRDMLENWIRYEAASK